MSEALMDGSRETGPININPIETVAPLPAVVIASASAVNYTAQPLRSRTSGLSSLGRRTMELVRPERPIGAAPTVLESLKAIILASWINILLLFIPVSWILHFVLPESTKNQTIIFVCSFMAIIPLAKLLAFATEELSLRVGQTLAGLMNATLGNAVELIVAIIALIKCELRVVQASLVGSILSNLLLVLGMCFFAGGLRYSEQGFGISATQVNASLLTISVIAVLLPAAFHFSADTLDDAEEARDILAVSHGVSIILLFIYVAYLAFQLYSHPNLYADKGEHVVATTAYVEPKFRLTRLRKHLKERDVEKSRAQSERSESPAITDSNQTHSPEPSSTATALVQPMQNVEEESEEELVEEPQLNLWTSVGLLVVVTVVVAVTAEFLVDSINGVTETGHISKEFVGIILLPIVGNAAEHATAVTVSVKDKLSLSLGVAVGSSIQIALFVIPFIVTLAWILHKPLPLLFDPYESVALFLSVLTVNYVVQDGKSNWLEGLILMCLYLILAVTFWFYPGSDPSGILSTCRK